MQASRNSFAATARNRLLLLALCAPLLAQTSVRCVKLLDSKEAVEIEIEVSDRIVPQTQVLTGPDRLVVDFPNAVPGSQLRSQSVNRAEVKDVRVGLLQARPPVTRIVLDLKTAQSYQVFPYGRTVIIKVTGSTGESAAGSDLPRRQAPRPGLVAANYATGAERIPADPAPKPAVEVSFHDGLLAINANKATLSEVLLAVQQRTGAQVSLAPGAEQEKVVANLGPAPASEVLASLLKGSRFNFLILSAQNDPRQLDRVILSPSGDAGPMPLAPMTSSEADDDQPVPPARAQAQPGTPARPPLEGPLRPPPEIPPAADDEAPEE
jgi:hypothetical protein